MPKGRAVVRLVSSLSILCVRVTVVGAIVVYVIARSSNYPCHLPLIAWAAGEPQCESSDTNVTCWGTGELLSYHIRESGLYDTFTYAKLEGITIIGTSAFHGCYQLTRIDFPSTVVEFKWCAFQSVPMSVFTVPASVTTIGDAAWNVCLQLSLETRRFTEVKLPTSQCITRS